MEPDLHETIADHSCILATSFLSIAMGLFGMIMFFRMDSKRRMLYRMEILFFLMGTDLLKALYMFCFSAEILYLVTQPGVYAYHLGNASCNGWGYMLNATTTLADCTVLSITIHNAIMIFFPQYTKLRERKVFEFTKLAKHVKQLVFHFQKKDFKFWANDTEVGFFMEGGIYGARWYIVVFITIYSVVTPSLIFVNGGNYEGNFICSAPANPVWKRLVSDWIIKYLNVISIIVVYLTIFIYLSVKLRAVQLERKNLYNTQNQNSPTISTDPSDNNSITAVTNQLQKDILENKTTKSTIEKTGLRQLGLLFIYPISYLIIWTVPTITQIRNYFGYKIYSPYAVRLIASILLPMSCFFDVLIFLLREKPWRFTKKAIRKRKEAEQAEFYYLHQDEEIPNEPAQEEKPRRKTAISFEDVTGILNDSTAKQKLRQDSNSSSNISNAPTTVAIPSTIQEIAQQQIAKSIKNLDTQDYENDSGSDIDLLHFLNNS